MFDGEVVEVPHTENTIVADQKSNTIGTFAQYGIDLEKLGISIGARFDHYAITDKESQSLRKTGNVFSPRITLKYNVVNDFQTRVSYSQGYRAPQIFDEDLHIETSGSRQVIHQNDPSLKQETSHSFMASVDCNRQLGKIFLGFLAEGFYTRLNDAFVNEYGIPDENGVVVYTRTNADGGAAVRGVNMELNLNTGDHFSLKSGFTIQCSRYEEAQEFSEKKFFRTPGNYGYLTLDFKPVRCLGISPTANYTGRMLIPYFGNQLSNPEAGDLRESDPFLDLGLKLRYDIRLNGATLQVFGGMKNVFNSWQDDFDKGIDRDPGYVYGPALPRTIYVGVRIGNMLN